MKHNWEYKRLGDICNILMGQSPASDSYNEEAKGLPFFQGCSDFGKINPSVTKYCSEPIRIAAENDILFSVRAPIGTMNIANLPCCIGRGLCSINIYNPNLQKYLFYALSVSKNKIIEKGRGSTFKAVGRDILHNHVIPIPPIPVQEQIVAELDKISEVIDDCRELLRNLDALAQSLFYDYFGDPITNPKGWKVKSLKDTVIGKLSYGSGASGVPYDNCLRYIRITDIDDNGNLKPEIASSPSAYDAKYDLFDGDILFARSGATVGKSFLYKDSIGKAIYAGYLIRATVNKNIIIPLYLYALTKTAYYSNYILSSIRGAAQPNVNAQLYGAFQIPVPPLPLQEQFAARIEQIEAQKKAVEETIANLQTLLNSRMDYWFN